MPSSAVIRRGRCGACSAGMSPSDEAAADPTFFANDGRGFIDRLPEPDGLPSWLSPSELDHYISEFSRTGFTGGINWYRNMDRNWTLTERIDGMGVAVPSLFIGGALDPVIAMTPPATTLSTGWPTIAAPCSSKAQGTGCSKRSPTRSTRRCSSSSTASAAETG